MEARVKTWGPFNGRHLTTIICVVIAALLLPIGAWAVSFTNVAITDPGGVNRAKVNAAGALSAAVSGSVTANNAIPTNLFHVVGLPADATWGVIAKPPAGKALVITSIVVEASQVSSPGQSNVTDVVIDTKTATCNLQENPIAVASVTPPNVGVSTIAIPSGLVVPANRALCAGNWGTGYLADVAVFGYLVPAASAPVNPT
jgi:hypothetical protein